MSIKIKTPKKLIEVALPLDDINIASAREKSIRHGHPSTLHMWWARRPLAAARAVIFAQMVNDPGYQQGEGFKYGVNKEKAAIEREKLFDIIRDLVKWENINNEEVLNRARDTIKKSWYEICALNKDHPEADNLFNPNKLPDFHDPFAGGGTIPLEAQRLGLRTYASDLNPVAVMLNKAMVEIPPIFSGINPIGPLPDSDRGTKKSNKDVLENWSGAKGLAEDVRRYGHWILEQAYQRIGDLFPTIKITPAIVKERPDLKSLIGEELTINAWIWARTVKSPNPAFSHVDVPLASSFLLSSKKKKEVYVEPVVENTGYKFLIKVGTPPKEAKNGTKSGRGGNFKCLMSGAPIPVAAVREQGQQGTLKQRLMAVVAESKSGRIYLSPTDEMTELANSVQPTWKPENKINHNPRDIRTQLYGMYEYGDLFTSRQLVALNCFSDLVNEVRHQVIKDAKSSGWTDDGVNLDNDGINATAYSDAIACYLGLALGRATDYWTTLATWENGGQFIAHAFTKQAIPMVWDYAESNPFSSVSGNWLQTCLSWVIRVINNLPANTKGKALQKDAQTQSISINKVISTDPPYYDNIAYADLADYFYVWMRKTLKDIFPGIFSTMNVPKDEELVASSYRHGSKESAEQFFLEGMSRSVRTIQEQSNPCFPVSIYYAFKQTETKKGNTSNTGWEVFLEAVIKAGFSITGTWPLRTERSVRSVAIGSNALASSVVLICQKHLIKSETISRRQFQRQLREGMPEALEAMIGGSEGASPIAPVDLAQAAIGPGMGIFSQYESVLNQDGSAMSVHDALVLINRAITDYLNPNTGDFDNDTLFCDSWFAEYGWSAGEFGQANVLAQAKGTTVDGVQDAGVIESGAGKVRLLKWKEYPTDWDPKKDNRTPVWEAMHHLIRAISQQGESGAGALLSRMPERGEAIRQLAYHLYTLCERKGWAEDARAYNELISAWHAIVSASHDIGHIGSQEEFEI